MRHLRSIAALVAATSGGSALSGEAILVTWRGGRIVPAN